MQVSKVKFIMKKTRNKMSDEDTDRKFLRKPIISINLNELNWRVIKSISQKCTTKGKSDSKNLRLFKLTSLLSCISTSNWFVKIGFISFWIIPIRFVSIYFVSFRFRFVSVNFVSIGLKLASESVCTGVGVQQPRKTPNHFVR
jgi:hypothetical protein